MIRFEDRERGRLWSRSSSYKRKVERTLGLIETALRARTPLFVAFSCGKDSAAMFDLVREIDPSIEGRFVRWPETHLIDNFDEVIDAWRQRGASISVLDLHRSSLSEKTGDRWNKLRETSPSRGSFVGLREDESRARRITLRSHGRLYTAKDGFVRCCPISDWTTNDVVARIVDRDLPILSAYGHGEGIDGRTVARVPREIVREKFVDELKGRDFAAYRALQQIYPEL